MINNSVRILNTEYRYIFLVQNRDYWNACPFEYDLEKDLVLSFDFAVVNLVKSKGGEAQYIDHIVSSEIMESYNYKTYDFFAHWHYNANKEDIFSYKGIEVGSAFRIEIWNDLTFYVRIFINVHELLKSIKYERIYAGIDDPVVNDVLEFLKIANTKWPKKNNKGSSEYYFPIFKWMDDALHPSDIKYKARIFILRVLNKIFSLIRKLFCKINDKKYVYVEWYHPTKDIISALKRSNAVNTVQSDFSGINSIKDLFNGLNLPIPVSLNADCSDIATQEIIKRFNEEKCATLFIDETDISNELHKLIIKRISPLVAKSFKIVDAIIKFFNDKRLCLMITMASIGVVNRLMINYCNKNNVTVYMIINGWLGNSFLDEAKSGGTWINSYSDAIKKNYFMGMDNIVCLGDPRMDKFAMSIVVRKIDYNKPTIGIGASGFTNVDLNCYLAIEFEFLNDVMNAFRKLKEMGREMNIIIKIRQNGYIEQYEKFLQEYYPDMSVSLFDSIPINQIYERVDFFISIYSQSLFEASCLGIPVLYYKNDTQYFQPPFDGESEIVTGFTPDDLISKIEAFYNRDAIYDSFKEKKIMGKYIGPLDGQNLKRNMDFIYSLMPDDHVKTAH